MSDPPKPSFTFPPPTMSSGVSGIFATATSALGAKTTQGGTLFGSTTRASSNTFGSTATSTAPSQSLVFGSGASTGQASPGIGGQNLSGATAFGGFGFSTPNKSQDTAGGGSTAGGNGVFGSSAPSSQASLSTTPAPSKPGGGFPFSTTPAGPPPGNGGAATSVFNTIKSQQASNLFGPGPGQSSSQGSSSLSAPLNPFTNPAKPAVSGLFGSTKPADSATNQTTAQTASGVFGTAPSTPGAGLFGSKPAPASQPAGFNFSQPPSSQPQGDSAAKQSPFNLTGQKPFSTPTSTAAGQSVFGAAQKPLSGGPFSFPSSTMASSGTPVDSGATAASPISTGAQAGSLPNFSTSFLPAKGMSTGGKENAPVAATAANTAAATSGSTASAFGLFGEPKKAALATTAPPAQSNPLSLGQNTTNTAASVSGVSTPTAAPSLFGQPKKPEVSATSQATGQPAATSTVDNASKSTSLGASMTGPRPHPQSTLKNKSMDEIINRWANDLAKYQKEFQKQAMKISEWDRQIVENAARVQKLYANTLEAERATVEIERQLSHVENDQAELENWLLHYEKQVDEIMSTQVGQGDSLQGPDGDRERTFKLAERVTDRIDEMGKDLSSMIEEINDASSNLSKTSKADDPLQQIVRVLNGHLSQLQQIDQGTAALQAKVAAAQKTSRSLASSVGANGLGNDAADEFYRSYMGRR